MAQDKSPVRWFHQPSPSDRCLLSVAPSRCALGAGLESTDRRQPQPLTAPPGPLTYARSTLDGPPSWSLSGRGHV